VGNSASNSAGALYLRLAGGFHVEDSRFLFNRATQYGGAVYDEGGTSIISNCLFTGNSVAGGTQPWGGAVRNAALLTRCVITSNSAAQRGGGVYEGGTARNCLIAFNSSPGGGIQNVASVENCTIVSNSVYGAYSFLMGCALTNCIVYGNAPTDISASNQSGIRTVMVANCGYATTGTTFVLIGNRNITDQAPGFVDPGAGNFRLRHGSPCIDAGVNLDWMAGAVDLDGSNRVVGGAVDLGAYEFCERPTAGAAILLR
jgi:hypothetical protein